MITEQVKALTQHSDILPLPPIPFHIVLFLLLLLAGALCCSFRREQICGRSASTRPLQLVITANWYSETSLLLFWSLSAVLGRLQRPPPDHYSFQSRFVLKNWFVALLEPFGCPRRKSEAAEASTRSPQLPIQICIQRLMFFSSGALEPSAAHS